MADQAEMMARADGLVRAGRLEEARAVAEEVAGRWPRDARAQSLLGWIAAQEEKWNDGAARYRAALEAKPGDAGLLSSLAMCLFRAGELEGAVEAASGALRLSPGLHKARLMLGQSLMALGRPMEACDHLGAFVAANPEHVDGAALLAIALKGTGRADEGIRTLRAKVEGARAGPEVLSLLCALMNYSTRATRAEVREVAEWYGASAARAGARFAKPVHRIDRGAKPARLRIGFVSPDFRKHSVGLFALPLLEGLRGRFEVCCYHCGVVEDSITGRFEGVSDVFRRVAAMSSVEIAERIGADGVHVLVDLAGHTTGHRLEVFELRPAPVQVSYLGFPAWTGLASMDYRVGDSATDPAGSEGGERVLRIDPCMLTFRGLEERPPVRAAAEGKVVLGCFGAVEKYNAGLIAAWARVLSASPAAELVLRHGSMREERLRREVLRRFERAGAKRVRIEEPGSREGTLLAQYDRIDLSLDTFPYNGTTTICESLAMGVPVVSLAGDRAVSRMGLSILRAVGLESLAAGSEEEYVRIAAGLANDGARLEAVRRGLRERFDRTLGDSAGFAARFGDAIESVWERWRGGG